MPECLRGRTWPLHAMVRLSCWGNWLRRHIADLLDEKLSFVDELLIIGTVFQEVRQEVQQLVAVHQQDLLNGHRLVRVSHKDLEDVKPFVLNHLPIVSQEVHYDLEVLASVDVCSHDVVV